MRFARVFVLSLTSQPMGFALVILKPFTRQRLEKQLESLTSGQYIRDFLSARVTEKKGRLTVEFAMDHAAYQRLKSRVLGKRVLFMTNPELTDDEIVFSYRGQHHVERAFRDMKDPCFIRFSPTFHQDRLDDPRSRFPPCPRIDAAVASASAGGHGWD